LEARHHAAARRSGEAGCCEHLVYYFQVFDAERQMITNTDSEQIERLNARVSELLIERDTLARALMEIKHATLDGRVCDDVAWFDRITTLHDFCDMALDRLTEQERKAALGARP
jgi:dihydroneopterin aldolase